MQDKDKTKQFVSELRSLLFKHEIRIIAENKKLYFQNDDMDIKVEINEELNNEILEIYGLSNISVPNLQKLMCNNQSSFKWFIREML